MVSVDPRELTRPGAIRPPGYGTTAHFQWTGHGFELSAGEGVAIQRTRACIRRPIHTGSQKSADCDGVAGFRGSLHFEKAGIGGDAEFPSLDSPRRSMPPNCPITDFQSPKNKRSRRSFQPQIARMRKMRSRRTRSFLYELPSAQSVVSYHGNRLVAELEQSRRTLRRDERSPPPLHRDPTKHCGWNSGADATSSGRALCSATQPRNGCRFPNAMRSRDVAHSKRCWNEQRARPQLRFSRGDRRGIRIS